MVVLNPRVRVLVIDDSAFMRSIISRLVSSDSGLEVVATARDGVDGLKKIEQFDPDVITLDIEMPRMDGLQMLEQLLATDPRPVIMVSSIAQPQAKATMRAFELGAVDVVTKPSGQISLDMHSVQEELVRKIKVAAGVQRDRLQMPKTSPRPLSKKTRTLHSTRLSSVVVIGSSTGGPGALSRIVPELPATIPAGVLIVQHMPIGFTKTLAQHLDRDSCVTVKEAESGDRLVDGSCLVAAGGTHLECCEDMSVLLTSTQQRHGVRPAVDVTLESISSAWAGTTVVAILTGMGMDGAAGAARIKKLGGTVIAQDEASSVVYGMPRAVADMGITDYVVPVDQIAHTILRLIDQPAARRIGV